MINEITLLQFLSILLSFIAGAFVLWLYYQIRLKNLKTLTENILEQAETQAEHIKKSAQLIVKQNHLDQQKELEEIRQIERKKIALEDERLKVREDKLEDRMNLVEKKLISIEKKEAILNAKKEQLDEEKVEVKNLKNTLKNQLEHLSGLSSQEARQHLLQKLQEDIKTESANFIRKSKKEAEEEAEKNAIKIISTAINRMASPCVSEATINTVLIPNEEMKGRIIGREGRNIRALEHLTGVNLIIDETPGAVVLSGFDPVRMHIAKLTLTELIKDGRIHPTRIEEAVQKATLSIQKEIKHFGEDAALRIGAINLHPEIIQLLGKLKYRFSYGQNILDHSIEVAHLMGIMAAELGLDIRLAKRIGLLHDMGKALSHEVEGTHAIIGHDFALKYGEDKAVANGIGCHHFEMEATTIEASLCSAADAISASRPGARVESVEEYIKRLRNLEDLAYDFPGVEKAYALQAGREIRIVVLPDMIDDDGTITLARDLTKSIEQKINYPGKIKVTVIREKKVIEYAM